MFCGIDIGGTNTEVGLVSQEGKIIDREIVKTTKFYSASDLVLAISESIVRMTKVCKLPLEGIGVGCPNGNAYKGTMVHPANFPFKGEIPIKKLFTTYFPNIPIVVTNDANAAAIGELQYGKGKGRKDFVVVTLGTGMGSGFVVNGQVVNGGNGMAGEIGHTIMIPDGRPCGCGNSGCLERYVSASGIVCTYNELCTIHNHEPEIGNFKDLCTLAERKDQVAIDAFEKAGEILGWGLANAALVTAPTHIFLFGGVARAGDVLLQSTVRSFKKHLLCSYVGTVTIEYSGLMDKNAAVLGAASLPQQIR